MNESIDFKDNGRLWSFRSAFTTFTVFRALAPLSRTDLAASGTSIDESKTPGVSRLKKKDRSFRRFSRHSLDNRRFSGKEISAKKQRRLIGGGYEILGTRRQRIRYRRVCVTCGHCTWVHACASKLGLRMYRCTVHAA